MSIGSLKWVIPLVAATLSIICARSAFADEVRLKNGDRLTGQIVRMEEGVLLLKTSYAGDVKIDRNEIECLVSDGEATVVLGEKQRLKGRLACPEDGSVSVAGTEAQTTAPMPISAVEAINPSPEISSSGNIVIGASKSSGNTDNVTSSASGKFQTRAGRQRFTAAGKYDYGDTDGVEDKRNASGTLKYDIFLSDKLYGYANTLLENDKFQDLKLRSTLGAGLGYQFYDNERIKLFFEAGPAYINKDYYEAEDESGGAGRWSLGFDWNIIPDRLKFFHLHEGYYYSSNGGAYYIRSEQGLRLPLLNRFFANLQLDYDYDSEPAPGKERSDTTYIFGLGYEFAF